MENIVGVNGLLYVDMNTGECTEDRTQVLEWILNGSSVRVEGFTTPNPITGRNDWHSCGTSCESPETESDSPVKADNIPEISGIDTPTLEELYRIIGEELEVRHEELAGKCLDEIDAAIQKAIDFGFEIVISTPDPTAPNGCLNAKIVGEDAHYSLGVGRPEV